MVKTTEKMTETAAKEQPKKKKSFFRTVTSTFFDVPRWIGAKQYVEVNKTLYSRVKDSFRISQAERQETFEAAMHRLKLNEQDLKDRMVANQRGLTMMLILIVMLCLYGFYLIYSGAVAGTLMILAVIIFSAVRAFQYSFWNFQIKNRVLGCSFLTWWNGKKNTA